MIGCTLMCIGSSMVGVILLLQKRLLKAESISHAAYPGALLAILGLAFFQGGEEYAFLAAIGGALGSGWLGMRVMKSLGSKWKVPTDAALSFTLSLFFGVGVLLASFLQSSFPSWIHQAQILLFGQVATLSDEHIWIYGGLAGASALFIFLSLRHLQVFLFDRLFGDSVGLSSRWIERILLGCLLFSIVIGIRSVGVVLISGMLVAPAVAARQWSNRLSTLFWLAALFGAASGLIGNFVSVEVALRKGLYIPTGPLILLTGAVIAVFSLLLAPRRGVLFRMGRLASFRLRCLEENLLKGLWKRGSMDRAELKRHYPDLHRWILFRLLKQGWAVRKGPAVFLSRDGEVRASSIVRLHRLWELYLTEQVGLKAAEVHKNAEEMEHVLTPDLEARLTRVLLNPEQDPHRQPIPKRASLEIVRSEEGNL